MPVAIGRCVDEDQQSFRTGRDGVLVVAILRADIDRRFIWRDATRKNVVELGGIIAREEDVMPAQRETARLGEQAPSHGGQRAGRGWDCHGCMADRHAEQPVATAPTSAFTMTASAAMRSPLASLTPLTRRRR